MQNFMITAVQWGEEFDEITLRKLPGVLENGKRAHWRLPTPEEFDNAYMHRLLNLKDAPYHYWCDLNGHFVTRQVHTGYVIKNPHPTLKYRLRLVRDIIQGFKSTERNGVPKGVELIFS